MGKIKIIKVLMSILIICLSFAFKLVTADEIPAGNVLTLSYPFDQDSFTTTKESLSLKCSVPHGFFNTAIAWLRVYNNQELLADFSQTQLHRDPNVDVIVKLNKGVNLIVAQCFNLGCGKLFTRKVKVTRITKRITQQKTKKKK